MTEKPETTTIPLSLVEFDPFTILIFKQTTKRTVNGVEGVDQEVLLSIKRKRRSPEDDTGAIPLTSVPTLIMMLEEIVRPGVTVQPLTPVMPPPAE